MNKVINKYFIYLNREQEPVPWNPPDPYPLDWVNYTYFGKVFEIVEKNLKVSGLVFYFTWDTVDKLPSYGRNVVAIIVGDEWCRVPTYYHKVLAVFKCYGIKPILGCNPFYKPSYLNILTLLQFLKVRLYRMPGWINYALNQLVHFRKNTNKILNIFDIPLGYDRQSDLPTKDMNNREYDVFFAGSIQHGTYSKWFLKYWIDNPKGLSRKKMISSLETLKIKYPDIRIELSITSSFGLCKDALDEKSYSKKMMDTKICLVPRGTSFETFRFFEAMRYGCIVVGEALPSRWFYDGSPAIQVNDWSDLGIILPRLLENKPLVQEKHQESLNWWKTKCSEAVVGEYIAGNLNSLTSSLKE